MKVMITVIKRSNKTTIIKDYYSLKFELRYSRELRYSP